MKFVKRKELFLLLIIINAVILLSFCVLHQKNKEQINSQTVNPQIAFVHLKLYNPEGIIIIKFISGSLQPGMLKQNLSSADTMPIPGYLSCVIKDERGNDIKKIVTENPLEKNIEFLNSNNLYERKIVKLKEADLFLRFQYNGIYKRLSVNIFDDNLINKELGEFELRFGKAVDE